MSSSATDLTAWTRERFRLSVYGPLALVLEAARLSLAGSCREPFVLRAALALTLLFGFRLWDDLASVHRDARDHPSRVLPRTPTLVPFVAAVAVAFGAAALFAMAAEGSGRRIALLATLIGYYVALYSYDRKARARGLAGSVAVLVKYPGIAVLLAGGHGVFTSSGVVALTTLFAAFALYEVAHDDALRALAPSRTVAGAAALATCVGSGILCLFAAPRGPLHALVQAAAAIAAGGFALVMLRATRSGRPPSLALRFSLFATIAVELALFGMGRF